MFHLTRHLSPYVLYFSDDVPLPSVGIFGDSTWSAGAPELDVNLMVSYSTMSVEFYASKEFELDLYCFGM